jgi:peroxiredoxin
MRNRPGRLSRVALGAAAVAALLAAGCSTGGSTGAGQTGAASFRYVAATQKGSVIPVGDRQASGDVRSTTMDGAPFSLAGHRGEVVVVNFWGSWCGPCVIESPVLDRIYRQMRGEGVLFVGIAVKDVESATRAFVTQNDISYPILFDFNAKSALQLGSIPMRGLPATVVIDRQGRVAGVFLGAVLAGDLEPVLRTLVDEP